MCHDLNKAGNRSRAPHHHQTTVCDSAIREVSQETKFYITTIIIIIICSMTSEENILLKAGIKHIHYLFIVTFIYIALFKTLVTK